MHSKKEKIKNIEILRFVCALAIVFYHLFHSGDNCLGEIFSGNRLIERFSISTVNGHIATDLFFVIAGFFTFYTLKENEKITDFIKNKISRLYPFVVLYAILDMSMKIFVYHYQDYLPHEQILRLLLIDNIGLNLEHSTITWFISALFWGLLLFRYAYDIFSKKAFNFLTGCIIVFCYSMILHCTNGNLGGHTINFYNIFNAGMMRSIGGIGIGYFIYLAYISYKNKPYKNTKSKIVFSTLAEGFLIFFVFNNLFFHKLNYYSNFIILIGMVLLFWLLITKQGLLSRFLDVDICQNFGKYAYSIFIIHYPILCLFSYYIWQPHKNFVLNHLGINIVLPIIISVLFGIIFYHLLQKPTEYLKQKLIS